MKTIYFIADKTKLSDTNTVNFNLSKLESEWQYMEPKRLIDEGSYFDTKKKAEKFIKEAEIQGWAYAEPYELQEAETPEQNKGQEIFITHEQKARIMQNVCENLQYQIRNGLEQVMYQHLNNKCLWSSDSEYIQFCRQTAYATILHTLSTEIQSNL